jgi:hypothetical protein
LSYSVPALRLPNRRRRGLLLDYLHKATRLARLPTPTPTPTTAANKHHHRSLHLRRFGKSYFFVFVGPFRALENLCIEQMRVDARSYLIGSNLKPLLSLLHVHLAGISLSYLTLGYCAKLRPVRQNIQSDGLFSFRNDLPSSMIYKFNPHPHPYPKTKFSAPRSGLHIHPSNVRMSKNARYPIQEV